MHFRIMLSLRKCKQRIITCYPLTKLTKNEATIFCLPIYFYLHLLHNLFFLCFSPSVLSETILLPSLFLTLSVLSETILLPSLFPTLSVLSETILLSSLFLTLSVSLKLLSPHLSLFVLSETTLSSSLPLCPI